MPEAATKITRIADCGRTRILDIIELSLKLASCDPLRDCTVPDPPAN